MKEAYTSSKKFLHAILAVVLIIICAGCFTVKLVSDYDEQIDTGITALQKKTEGFLINLKPYSPQAEQFYNDVRVDISSLRVRADSLQRNSLTVKMLDKLSGNINRLEGDHKQGISADEIPLYREGLNSQFTSILTFELAKKRGETPDDKNAQEATKQPQ